MSSLFRWARAHQDHDAIESPSLRLVELVPTEPQRDGTWAWEVATERGFVRGRDALDLVALRALVDELVGARGPR